MKTFSLREPFELTIEVQPSDIDRLNHVNNVVYLRWIQDVAIAHWEAVASNDDLANFLWVVARHEIDYKAAAVLGDSVVARTWIGGASRARFERHTEILRLHDRKILTRALTLWCPVHPQSGRPFNLSREDRERFSVSTPP